jgi:hypothetical protein
MTVHLLGRVAVIRGIGKVSIGQRHRKIGDRRIEETENLDIRNCEIPIRDISIRSGPSDHCRSGPLKSPKAIFSRFGILKKKREKPVALYHKACGHIARKSRASLSPISSHRPSKHRHFTDRR